MSDRMLLDTDVLVDYLRGREEAVEWLEGATGALLISAVTVAELYAGVRDASEREAVGAFLRAFETVPVDRPLAERGGLLRREYGRSHGTGLGDALIAAAAQERGARLVTLNSRHFPMFQDILVPYQKQ